MDYRYLKAFFLTANLQSFSKAAIELNIAQSAVSRQIKLLEESLGEELLLRSSKSLLLTDKGKKLFRLIETFDKSAQEIFTKDDQRPIKIGVLHGLLENWFGQVIVEFNKISGRNLLIHVDRPEQLKQELALGRFDMIFTTENIQSEMITSLKLFNENLTLISSKPIALDDLSHHRWIVYHISDPLYRVAHKVSERIITVDSITTVVNLVCHGVGIAIVPDHVLKPEMQLHCYRQESLRLPVSEIYMATLNYQKMPEHLKEIVALIQEMIP